MGTFTVTIEIGDPQGGRWETLEAMVDTGSTYTTLPASLLHRLGVESHRRAPFILADGREVEMELGQTWLRIDGRQLITIVAFGEEGTEPILGAVTLEEFLLAPDPVGQRLISVPGRRMSLQGELSGKLLFDLSVPGRRAFSLPQCDVPEALLPPKEMLRDSLVLPQVSEVELVRYFTHLSTLNYGVETGMYPLGSCTMKYNPKVHEDLARLPGFLWLHPLQPEESAQGALELLYGLQEYLSEITGMATASLAPAAGAHGELTGILMAKAYHQSHGDTGRTKVLVPDSAHGTNPATAAMAGYQVVPVPSDSQGNTDPAQLRSLMTEEVAALMLTQPNTLGLFDTNIIEIADIVHSKGGILYGDGANLNALLGRAKPKDMGFDIIHLNLHKTFSTPHGGGGPGAGPVCANERLAPFLPTPIVTRVTQKDGTNKYSFITPEKSIGKMGGFYGNFGVLVRAYAYIRSLGAEGLKEVSDNAVINANYLMSLLKGVYHLKYNRRCMHEVVLAGTRQKAKGVNTLAIAKRLIDYGFHPPTIYFPLIVEEALMIEPTETESRETLDAFAAALLAIAREAEENPELVKTAPHSAPVGRLDEATAARRPYLRWRPES